MEVQTLVKITNSKDKTELYTLFCLAAQGEYVETTKKSNNSSDIANLEHTISNAFDAFAQDMFEKGMEYERNKTN